MTIVVTGGAGFIGSNFVLDWLRAQAEPVVVVDKLTYAGNLGNVAEFADDPRLRIERCDICDGAAVARVFAVHAPRAVVHFAAETHVDRSIDDADAFLRANVEGTFRLLDAALGYWRGLPPAAASEFRFLHVSTDEVYGALGPDGAPFTETHPYRPNSPYSATKAAADHLVRAWFQTYGLPVLTTNCSNNYGPRQFPEKLIPLMILNALAGKALPLYGDGCNVRDWIYVADHCAGVRRVLEAGIPGEVYNLGGGQEKTNIAVVRAVCRRLDAVRPRPDGKTYADQLVFVKDRPGHDRRYAIDSAKAERALGWKPAHTFETGIAKTVDWYLANGAWVASVETGAYRNWIARQYAGLEP